MVRNVADEAEFLVVSLLPFLEIDVQKVLIDDRDLGRAELLPQFLHDATVNFNEDKMPHAPRKLARQCSPARSNLDDNVVRVQVKITDDIPRDILVDEEVLSEGLPGFRENRSLHRSV